MNKFVTFLPRGLWLAALALLPSMLWAHGISPEDRQRMAVSNLKCNTPDQAVR